MLLNELEFKNSEINKLFPKKFDTISNYRHSSINRKCVPQILVALFPKEIKYRYE